MSPNPASKYNLEQDPGLNRLSCCLPPNPGFHGKKHRQEDQEEAMACFWIWEYGSESWVWTSQWFIPGSCAEGHVCLRRMYPNLLLKCLRGSIYYYEPGLMQQFLAKLALEIGKWPTKCLCCQIPGQTGSLLLLFPLCRKVSKYMEEWFLHVREVLFCPLILLPSFLVAIRYSRGKTQFDSDYICGACCKYVLLALVGFI